VPFGAVSSHQASGIRGDVRRTLSLLGYKQTPRVSSHTAARTRRTRRGAACDSRWVHSTPASRESREIGVVVDASKAFEGVNGGLVCTGVFLDARARSAHKLKLRLEQDSKLE